jgi:hypothetical protein
MRTIPRAARMVALLLLVVAPPAGAAERPVPLAPVDLLRPEWTIERTPAGRARVVGYLYNDNGLRNAANVWLRVEQVTAGVAPGAVYQSRIVGDVLAGGRMLFDVPVADPGGAVTYRVSVESVDWFMECR